MTDTQETPKQGRDAPLLDTVKQAFNLMTDAELALLLGVTKTGIHTVRFKGGLMGKKGRIKIMEKIGYMGVHDWSERIKPENLTPKIKALGVSLASFPIRKPNDEFLELLKCLFECENDYQLAEHLKLRPNTLSMFRTGRTTIGELPLLNVVAKVENWDYNLMIEPLINSHFLIAEVEKYMSANPRTSTKHS